MKLLNFLYLLLISLVAHGQVSGDLNQTTEELKKSFPKADLGIVRATTVFDFFLDKTGGSLQARHKESEQYVALRSNATFVRKVYYSDRSSIDYYTLKSEKGKSVAHDKLCGHYESDDVFYSDAQLCVYHSTLDIPGTTVSFETASTYKDARYLTKAFLHNDVPAAEHVLQVNIPDWATIEMLEMNFAGYDITKSVKKEGNMTIHTFVARQLPFYEDKENVPGIMHYYPYLLFLYKSYTANGKEVELLSSTKDLYRWYRSLASGINHNYDALKPLVEEITQGKSDDEKIQALYYWVQDNIKYIAFEDGIAAFKPEDASVVLYNRYGDCKGMANLLKDMLTLAGFDARLTWIGTNRIPINHDIPTLSADNHMICTVLRGDSFILLDATEKYNPIGLYAERIQGKELLIEDGDSYIIKKVPAESIEKYTEDRSAKFRIDNQRLVGEASVKVHGEHKKILLNVLHTIKADDRSKVYKKVASSTVNPNEIRLINQPVLDRDQPLSLSYGMEITNRVSSFDKELYVNLDLYDMNEYVIRKERKVPFNLHSKLLRKSVSELEIPADYSVKYLPEPLTVENEFLSFRGSYQIKGNKVIYSYEAKVLTSMVPVNSFESWNKSITSINKFHNDQIILQPK